MDAMKKETLYCTEGGSDKQYTLWIEKRNGGFVVQAQWGPRGGSVQSGTKTPAPVDLDRAEKVYQKVLSEKLAKGYHPGEDAPAFSTVDGAKDSGLRPMLLTDATELGADRFIGDGAWGAQEKKNGKHIILKVGDGQVVGVNRRGLECAIPKVVTDSFLCSYPPFPSVIDGELVGAKYYAFDLLSTEGGDVRTATTEVRHAALLALLGAGIGTAVYTVPLIEGSDAKAALVAKLEAGRREGVVFKRLAAPYVPGKIENLQKALMVKVKFYSEGTFVVMGWNEKSSIQIGALGGDGGIRPVGNVTVPQKFVAQVDEANGGQSRTVRVRYLYATPNRILYQPTLDPDGAGLVYRDDAEITKVADLKLEGKDEE